MILRVETDEAVILQRLAARSDDSAAVSDADRAVYEKLKSALEPVGPQEADLVIPVSGDVSSGRAGDEILARLATFV